MFFFKKNESWKISENEVTSEEKFLNRRAILKPLLSFTISPFLISFPSYKSHSGVGYSFTSKINKKYIIDRKITEERFATTYTNFYEFGSSKNIWRRAGKLVTNPWLIEIDGLVKKPKKYDIRDFIRVLGDYMDEYNFSGDDVKQLDLMSNVILKTNLRLQIYLL